MSMSGRRRSHSARARRKERRAHIDATFKSLIKLMAEEDMEFTCLDGMHDALAKCRAFDAAVLEELARNHEEPNA